MALYRVGVPQAMVLHSPPNVEQSGIISFSGGSTQPTLPIHPTLQDSSLVHHDLQQQPHHMPRLLSSLPCSEMGMLKSLKLMHNGSPFSPPNLLEWKKATALHTLHIHMYSVLPIQCSHLVKDLILEGCTSPDRPAGGGTVVHLKRREAGAYSHSDNQDS
ncbi:hypothetical protein ARMGADRAFT_1072444 [Armillaria gallica]|uniref:Uncharacterized protein n=1 Tax=Armillaria gallica TaxID=47427 RepID=A0A2H3DY11_ARMGA|nr:hypothetical protein ARMGADRAFT_1072444 [Armillaria gallica]